MSYDRQTLESLSRLARAGDRTAYYRKIIELRDPYGAMALGVVKQSNIAGVVARRYAIAVSRRYCKPLQDSVWLEISDELMAADLAGRQVTENFQPGTPLLRWNVIRDYHVATFGGKGYPPETWTAWIPLHVDGDANASGLWRRMLTENFLTVAVQTVWLVSGQIAHSQHVAQDFDLEVVPRLQISPPLATGIPPDPKMAACMAKLAPYQLPKSGVTDNERLAILYLSVLAEDPGMVMDMAAIAPTSAWRSRPPLISRAY